MNDEPALTSALRTLASGQHLTHAASRGAVTQILSGEATDASVSAFLMGLRVKGETAEELAGAVQAVRDKATISDLNVSISGLLDTCGTGGDGAHTVNVSTSAAIVVAACGVPVAKHGNRAATSSSGSAEVLAELGVSIDVDCSVLNRCLSELGIMFLFAPKFHPGLKGVAPVRKQLPFRTLFNLVGPLANPASPEFQLVGVAGAPQADLVAGALARLGTRRAAVVTGCDGLDEVTLSGPTRVLVVEKGLVEEQVWEPGDFGVNSASVADLRVSGPADSAAKITQLLAGSRGPIRDTVVANAAAALWVARDLDLKTGVAQASEAIDSGRAANLLTRWRALTHGSIQNGS